MYRGFKNKNRPLKSRSGPKSPWILFVLITCWILFINSSYFVVQILWILFVLITWKHIILRILLNFLVLIFWNILIFCYSYFLNPKNFAPAALVNQCKSLVYTLWMAKIFSPAALQIHCISSSFLAPQTIISINKNLQFIDFATKNNSFYHRRRKFLLIRMWNFLYFLIFCCLRIFYYFFFLKLPEF